MTELETDHDRLIRIEGHVAAIKEVLEERPQIRHINKDGICDAYHTVIDHDRRINQWTGALAAVAVVCSLIGAAIGVVLSKLWP